MLRSRFGHWLIEEALPAMAFAAGFGLVPDGAPDNEVPALKAQLAFLLEVVGREEKRWATQSRIEGKR